MLSFALVLEFIPPCVLVLPPMLALPLLVFMLLLVFMGIVLVLAGVVLVVEVLVVVVFVFIVEVFVLPVLVLSVAQPVQKAATASKAKRAKVLRIEFFSCNPTGQFLRVARRLNFRCIAATATRPMLRLSPKLSAFTNRVA
jgi:hypothetical protein